MNNTLIYHPPPVEKTFQSILWDWLTTVDHKKIGILYLSAGGFFFLIGGLQSMLMRIQLIVPENTFLNALTYNQLLTMHGTLMIFLAAMPLLFGFMNFIVPLQIGARDVAFPFINALGFWLFLAGGILLNISWIMGGAPSATWTSVVPLSSHYISPGIDFYVLGLQISGAGTLMSGINFMVTIFNMRAPGMTLMRMPLFTWATLAASGLILFAFPALTVGLFMIMFDRIFGGNFFNIAAGGNSLIYEHLFWVFGHPEVYILVLPVFGLFSDIISTFSQKRIFGYSAMVFAVILIGFLGFMVWVHHMFTVGLGPVPNIIFGLATMAIAVPTGIKVFSWLFTMWGGRVRFTTASLFAISFIPTFVIGGVTGVMLSIPSADYQFHDTYFVVAHFHYVIVGGVVFGILSAVFYWWPKMFNYKLHEPLGIWTFWLFTIGFHLTFFIQHFLGLWGMPRRFFTYIGGQGLDTGNLVSSIGAFLMAGASVLLLINIFITHKKKELADPDPWNGRTLEWAVPTPVPVYNFDQIPRVRGLDTFFLEKLEGNQQIPPAEPPAAIHMPSNSIVPLIMAVGFLIAGFGLCLHIFFEQNIIPFTVAGLGVIIAFIAMIVRSFYHDYGYHLHPPSTKETHSNDI